MNEGHLCRPIVSLSCFQKSEFCGDIIKRTLTRPKNETSPLKVALIRYFGTHSFYSLCEFNFKTLLIILHMKSL